MTDDRTQPAQNTRRSQQAAQYYNQRDYTNGGALNGTALNTAQWLSDISIAPPSLHRLMNATCLTATLYGGLKLADTLAGQTLGGAKIAKENVWGPLQGLHGLLSYRKHSPIPIDRWNNSWHYLIPVFVGMFGTYAGSAMFFRERYNRLQNSQYLEDFTDKVLMDEAEPFAKAAAVTSIVNTGSGLHTLPFLAYGSNLQNRFMLANGQQACSPIIGQIWSANPSSYPWHVRRTLDFMVNYSLHNPAEFPREYPNIVHAIIAKLYPHLAPDQLREFENRFIDKLYEVRDPFWQQGGIPDEKKEACRSAFHRNFRGEGLEMTLESIGLNPLDASLDNNGLAGWVARTSGAAGQVAEDIGLYRQKYLERKATRAERLKDGLPPPPDAEEALISDAVLMDSRAAPSAILKPKSQVADVQAHEKLQHVPKHTIH